MTTTRPWENMGGAPWLTAQPLYDRVITVRRPLKPAGIGAIGYQGLLPVNETVLFTGVAASIQYQPKRDRPLGGVPSDAATSAQWHVYVAAGTMAAGQVVERDVIADDLGRRFRIFAAWPTALGWVLACELLEA